MQMSDFITFLNNLHSEDALSAYCAGCAAGAACCGCAAGWLAPNP